MKAGRRVCENKLLSAVQTREQWHHLCPSYVQNPFDPRLVRCSKFELVVPDELRVHDNHERCYQPWRHWPEANFPVRANRPLLTPEPRSGGMI